MFSDNREQDVKEYVQSWTPRQLYVSQLGMLLIFWVLLFIYISITRNWNVIETAIQEGIVENSVFSVAIIGSKTTVVPDFLAVVFIMVQVFVFLKGLFIVGDIVNGIARSNNFPRTVSQLQDVKFVLLLLLSLFVGVQANWYYQGPLSEYMSSLLVSAISLPIVLLFLVQAGVIIFNWWYQKVRVQTSETTTSEKLRD